MTVARLLALAGEVRSGLALPQAELSYLLADLLDCRPLELALRRDQDLEPGLEARFWACHSRLLAGEPPQYIVGHSCFYGLELDLSPAVLIPRPETEGLVELALSLAKSGARVLDIGTGSGAIAIALKHEQPGLDVTATDISADALAVASRNAANHNCRIAFLQADLFPPGERSFDLIVSNPPYVSPAEYAALEPRVRDFEPRSALLAEQGGLEFTPGYSPRPGASWRRTAACCSSTARPNARLSAPSLPPRASPVPSPKPIWPDATAIWFFTATTI